MFGLTPKDDKFFAMFREMTWNIVEGAELLKDMLDNYHDPEKSQLRIKEVEHKGDTITHEIIKKLNKSFVTPLEREDILALAHALDDVVDCLDGVSERLVLYKVTKVMPLAAQLAHLVVLGSEELVPLIAALRNMSNTRAINSQIHACMELENQADAVFHQALAEIFDDPKDPIELIKWKEILALLEDATDRIELVSKVVSSTVMRNA